MHRFSARIETNDLIVRIWEDAGFTCVDREASYEQCLDVLVLSLSTGESLENRIISVRPKVFVVMGCYELSPVLADLYSKHSWCCNDLWLTIGTLLDASIPEPLWPADDSHYNKAVADTVYRHLLNDVFRETAEWCGHMSSVVRPM